MYKISENQELAQLTTFHLAARAARMIEYDNATLDLPELLRTRQLGQPRLNLGLGANLLFAADYGGTILRSIDRRVSLTANADGSVTVVAASGVVLDELISRMCSGGIRGLENLSGIPATIGGAMVQNVGAYGAEIGDVVTEVFAFDTKRAAMRRFSAAECRFGYRHSVFKRPDHQHRYIICYAVLTLGRTSAPNLSYAHLSRALADQGIDPTEASPEQIRKAVLAMRSSKLPDPAAVGSAGSFFKNPVMQPAQYREIVRLTEATTGSGVEVPHYDLPDGTVKIPAAWLIDQCGLKGARVGGAQIWDRQPLVIANPGGTATGADVTALRQLVTESVLDRFGVLLQPEVIIVNG